MFDPKALDGITEKLSQAIPPGFNHVKEDLEKHIHALLQSGLSRLDLVSREEFDVQKAVLAKTRSRLEQLEQRVAELEQQLKA